ncbi:MAG: DMT family transporter [Granulosicoccus sp.]|nr:DMT family transporter [Granulosicoccus sp.]
MPALHAHFRAVVGTLQELNGPELRKPGLADHACLLGAAALWGSSFILNEVALADFPPVAIATYRIVLAAAVVCVICRRLALRVRLSRRTILLFAAIGILNSAVPFTLIGWGQLRIDSATTAILLASTPFSTLLFSHFMTRDDRFSWSKLAGLTLGFIGVFVLLGDGVLRGGGSLAGMLAIVLAGCCYSMSSLLIRRLAGTPALVLVAGTLVSACIVLVPVLLYLHPPWQQSWHADTLGALVFLALGPTAIAYVLRAHIVQVNGAVFMSNVGYLIPLFAVAWGWIFLSQQPSLVMWLSLGLILAGIAVGQRSKLTVEAQDT